MSGLFGGSSSSNTTSAAQARADELAAAEAERSETDRIATIQKQLTDETTSRSRGYGLRSLFGALGGGKTSLLGSG